MHAGYEHGREITVCFAVRTRTSTTGARTHGLWLSINRPSTQTTNNLISDFHSGSRETHTEDPQTDHVHKQRLFLTEAHYMYMYVYLRPKRISKRKGHVGDSYWVVYSGIVVMIMLGWGKSSLDYNATRR